MGSGNIPSGGARDLQDDGKAPDIGRGGKKVTDFVMREPRKMDLGGEGESKLHQNTAGEEEPPPGAGNDSRRRRECLW